MFLNKKYIFVSNKWSWLITKLVGTLLILFLRWNHLNGSLSFLFIYLKFLFIYLFIFGCIGSLPLRAGSLQLRRAGAIPRCGAWASHRGGLSRRGAGAAGTGAQQPRRTGSAAPRHAGSFRTRAWTRVPCTWQADSQPLRHQRSPSAHFKIEQIADRIEGVIFTFCSNSKHKTMKKKFMLFCLLCFWLLLNQDRLHLNIIITVLLSVLFFRSFDKYEFKGLSLFSLLKGILVNKTKFSTLVARLRKSVT